MIDIKLKQILKKQRLKQEKKQLDIATSLKVSQSFISKFEAKRDMYIIKLRDLPILEKAYGLKFILKVEADDETFEIMGENK